MEASLLLLELTCKNNLKTNVINHPTKKDNLIEFKIYFI